VNDIEGIVSYHDRALFLFESEYYIWFPHSGLDGEPQTWPERSGHVDGAFDAFLSGSQETLEKYVLLKSRELINGRMTEKYSYERLEENTELQMCS
jgi:hypothetical protein